MPTADDFAEAIEKIDECIAALCQLVDEVERDVGYMPWSGPARDEFQRHVDDGGRQARTSIAELEAARVIAAARRAACDTYRTEMERYAVAVAGGHTGPPPDRPWFCDPIELANGATTDPSPSGSATAGASSRGFR